MKDTNRALNIINLILAVMVMVLSILIAKESRDIKQAYEQISAEAQQNRDSLAVYQQESKAELEEIKKDIQVVKSNGTAYTDQIEGVSTSLESLKKRIEKQIEDINTKLKELEEAKLEKKAAEQEVLAASYTAPASYSAPTGGCLTPQGGVFNGPSGLETYYNLPMDGVIEQARNFGIEGEYWVREDGVKMYGDYVICACNRDVHPMGTLVETSLGTGISLDTGGFAAGNPTQTDIAVSW